MGLRGPSGAERFVAHLPGDRPISGRPGGPRFIPEVGMSGNPNFGPPATISSAGLQFRGFRGGLAVWGGTLVGNRIRNPPALAAPPGSLGDVVAGRATSGPPVYFQIPATPAEGKGRPRPKFRRPPAGKLAESESAGGLAFCRTFGKSGNQDFGAEAGLRPFGAAVFDVAVGRVLGRAS